MIRAVICPPIRRHTTQATLHGPGERLPSPTHSRRRPNTTTPSPAWLHSSHFPTLSGGSHLPHGARVLYGALWHPLHQGRPPDDLKVNRDIAKAESQIDNLTLPNKHSIYIMPSGNNAWAPDGPSARDNIKQL
ncbi:Hypothetical protein FKW44_019169 [Caligus rogercresseyi]|uniref:Uncharacterized protein n=1 Tax=Caligus rogercresseyi TaxID=217165 RepID=A0A7T8JX86_CALRO|nr:Hypothetical protein FKW44_019169 [Caligus rogercresseyi]